MPQQPDKSTTPSANETAAVRRHYQRRLVGGAILLLLLAVPSVIHSAAAIGSLRNLPANWLPDSLELKQDFLDFVNRFGVTDVILISWPDCQIDHESLRETERLLSQLTLNAEPSIESQPQQAFLTNARKLCHPFPPIDWVRSGDSIRQSLTTPPLNLPDTSAVRRLMGTLIGDDGKQTCLIVSLTPDARTQHRNLLPMIRSAVAVAAQVEASDVAMVGGPVDGAAVDGEAIRSISRYSLPSSVLAALLCLWCLRSIPLTLVVVGVATIGQGMVLALVYYSGRSMNAVLIVLPPLVFVLTVSAGIHLANYFLDQLRHGPIDRTIAARNAMRMGTKPCCMAALTTVTGLLSLLLVRLEPVQTFGALASVGIAGTLALLLGMLPGAMCIVGSRSKLPSIVRSPPMIPLRRGFRFHVSPSATLIAFAGLTSVAAVGLTRLSTPVSVPAMFDADSNLQKQYRWFETQVAATMSGDVLVTFNHNADSPREPQGIIDELLIVAKLHSAIRSVPDVGGVQSALTFLPTPTSAKSVSASARRAVIRNRLLDRPNEITRLGFLDSDETSRVWRIGIRLFQTRGDHFDRAIKAVERQSTLVVDSIPSQHAPVVATTGHIVIVQRSQELLLNDLCYSFVTAFAAIAVLMMVYLRSVLGGLIAMIPNVIPTFILFGTMGWMNIPLDIGSVMTASLALGIAIDDTVHLLMRYRVVRQSQSDRRIASREALRSCSTAMRQTTIVCGISLLAYGLSDFVPTRRFAFFMLGLLTIAWLSVTTVLPALMATRVGDRLVGPRPRSPS